jgi:hypothetical protein
MRGNALALAKPHAAFTILDRLEAIRAEPPSTPAPRLARKPRTRGKLPY